MDLYWAIALIITNLVWAVLALFLIKNEDSEKKELRDRFMARDFREYEYYSKELPEFQRERRLEIQEKKKKEKNEKPLTKEEREMKGIVERF